VPENPLAGELAKRYELKARSPEKPWLL